MISAYRAWRIQRTESKFYFDLWAQEHKLMTITFWWRQGSTENELRLKDRTFNEGLALAKEAGFVEPCWYKPWTWWNGVVTVG